MEGEGCHVEEGGLRDSKWGGFWHVKSVTASLSESGMDGLGLPWFPWQMMSQAKKSPEATCHKLWS